MATLLQPARRRKVVSIADESCGAQQVWDKCAKIRREILVPGYWDALKQNCDQWADELSVCPFWKAVKKEEQVWANAFSQKTAGGELLADKEIPPFVGKGKERVQEKILSGSASEGVDAFWSKGGAPIPTMNDKVRTRIQCRFLDGVEFFAGCLERLAEKQGIEFERERQGRLQGYFAQHFRFQQKVFFRWAKAEQPTIITCEVQIATALATRVWEESHRTYEQWRARADEPEDWQWNPDDPRFVARQLGHMIHLADGLLVQLRNTAKTKKI